MSHHPPKKTTKMRKSFVESKVLGNFSPTSPGPCWTRKDSVSILLYGCVLYAALGAWSVDCSHRDWSVLPGSLHEMLCHQQWVSHEQRSLLQNQQLLISTFKIMLFFMMLRYWQGPSGLDGETNGCLIAIQTPDCWNDWCWWPCTRTLWLIGDHAKKVHAVVHWWLCYRCCSPIIGGHTTGAVAHWWPCYRYCTSSPAGCLSFQPVSQTRFALSSWETNKFPDNSKWSRHLGSHASWLCCPRNHEKRPSFPPRLPDSGWRCTDIHVKWFCTNTAPVSYLRSL